MNKLKLVKLRHFVGDELVKTFMPDEIFVILGEIHNMPDHCVVAGYTTGKIYTGFHTDNFWEIPEDEI